MDGTLVVSYHPAVMTPALDRLADAKPSPRPVDERVMPGTWDVSGWLGGDAGVVLLAYLLEPDDEVPAASLPVETFRDVRFGIDVESADDARVLAEIAFADADSAAVAQSWLADGVEHLRERMESSGLSSTATDALDGERVRYELKLSGLESAFGRLIEARERGRQGHGDR